MKIVINFYLTWRCNFFCDHCVHECGPKGNHMTMEQLDYGYGFLRWLAQKKIPVVVIGLTGGEPTTHPGFWDEVMPRISEVRQLHKLKFVELHTNGSIPVPEANRRGYHRFFSQTIIGHDIFHRKFREISELHLDDYSEISEAVLLRKNEYWLGSAKVVFLNKKGRAATIEEKGKYEHIDYPGNPKPNCLWTKFNPDTFNVCFTPDHVNHCGEKSHPVANSSKPSGQYHPYGMDYDELLHKAMDYTYKYCGNDVCSEPCFASFFREKPLTEHGQPVIVCGT